jgi:hypothetical protein
MLGPRPKYFPGLNALVWRQTPRTRGAQEEPHPLRKPQLKDYHASAEHEHFIDHEPRIGNVVSPQHCDQYEAASTTGALSSDYNLNMVPHSETKTVASPQDQRRKHIGRTFRLRAKTQRAVRSDKRPRESLRTVTSMPYTDLSPSAAHQGEAACGNLLP